MIFLFLFSFFFLFTNPPNHSSIYLWLRWVLAAARAPPPPPGCGEQGPLLASVRGPAPQRPLASRSSGPRSGLSSHGPRAPERRPSSRGARAQPLLGMREPPGQGRNPSLPHWQVDSQPLHHQGSPSVLFFFLLFCIFHLLY